jgi:hypothetical protein
MFPLEISKTDGEGKAVHEECYVLKLMLVRAPAHITPEGVPAQRC